MTMWKPNEPVAEDGSNLVGIDLQNRRRRPRRRAWRDGLADQTVVQGLEDVRSYRAFEQVLIGSVDPRSALELALAHRLASLLWRLRRASAIEPDLEPERRESARPVRRFTGYPNAAGSQTPKKLNRRFGRVETV
jgi:hypothetical protein